MKKNLSPEQQAELSRRQFVRRAACAAVGMTAINATVRDLRLINAAAAAETQPNDYKAIVCLFLNGGNDANNLLVPKSDAGHAQYASYRKGLSIPKDSLLQLNPVAGDGQHTYGLHPNCAGLKTLFDEGKLAMLCNVGTLVEPITRAQYIANPRVKKVPQQLFSHQDQVVQWQTSIPDRESQTGWGGRMADLVNSMNAPASNGQAVSMSISLAGINTWEVGKTVGQYICGTSGPIGFNTGTAGGFNMDALNDRLKDINNLLIPAPPSAPQLNLYEKAYAESSKRAVDNFAAVNTAIAPTANTVWATPFQFMYPANNDVNQHLGTPIATNSSLMNQLKMVARLIAGRATLGHKRQIFFVSIGGYDLHDSQVQVTNTADPIAGTNPLWGPHAKLFAEISQSVFAFQRAIEQLALPAADGVTLFTASDFGRTFPMNSGFGSDHGWGNHQFVMGSHVLGKRLVGTYPTLTVNGPDDTGIGRWIPKISVDEYAATIAKWFGVGTSNLNTIFPNLTRFATPDLGFMSPPPTPLAAT